jgi:ribosome-associated heat shock protein Hsp15
MTPNDTGPDGRADTSRVRLDKWLWAARFYRTRGLAAEAIDAGQARLNGLRTKPAHVVRVGDTISVRKAGIEWEAAVTALSDRRGSAAEAATLYCESPASIRTRDEAALLRKAAGAAQPEFSGRPTKRQRRKLANFLGEG